MRLKAAFSGLRLSFNAHALCLLPPFLAGRINKDAMKIVFDDDEPNRLELRVVIRPALLYTPIAAASEYTAS